MNVEVSLSSSTLNLEAHNDRNDNLMRNKIVFVKQQPWIGENQPSPCRDRQIVVPVHGFVVKLFKNVGIYISNV